MVADLIATGLPNDAHRDDELGRVCKPFRAVVIKILLVLSSRVGFVSGNDDGGGGGRKEEKLTHAIYCSPPKVLLYVQPDY